MNNSCLETYRLDVNIGECLVCRRLNLNVHYGRMLAILGRNGVGKSTLLATLAGLRPPAGGDIRLDQRKLFDYPVRELARRRGCMLQEGIDGLGATVLQTALIGRHPHLGRWDWEHQSDIALARAALDDVGLAGLEHRSTNSLSGGERQRLAYAAVLTQSPGLYLLDEPLAHLDLKHQVSLMQRCTRLARQEGACVLVVLHQPGFALRYCDEVLLLYGEGRSENGPVSNLLNAERLSELYDYPMRHSGEGESAWFAPA